MLPTFLILGAAKAGTTSLHKYLEMYEFICMSRPKEPLFFEAEYENGPEFYLKKYFHHWKGEPVVGESRHRNLFLPYVPDRVQAILPDAKFIALLRDPVSRAYSHYWHRYVRGIEALSFEDAIEENLKRLQQGLSFIHDSEIKLYEKSLDSSGESSYRTYLDTGYYVEQIMRYTKLFGTSQLLLIRFEEFVEAPASIIGRILQFLGSPTLVTHTYTAQNEAVSKSAVKVRNFIRKIPIAQKLPLSIRDWGRNYIGRMLPASRPTMNIDTRNWLNAHYETHIESLEDLTGWDLSNWRCQKE